MVDLKSPLAKASLIEFLRSPSSAAVRSRSLRIRCIADLKVAMVISKPSAFKASRTSCQEDRRNAPSTWSYNRRNRLTLERAESPPLPRAAAPPASYHSHSQLFLSHLVDPYCIYLASLMHLESPWIPPWRIFAHSPLRTRTSMQFYLASIAHRQRILLASPLHLPA